MDYRELPEEFLEKMKQFLGEEYPEYLASYEEEPRSGLRVNTGRLTPEQFLEMAQTADWNLKPVPWTKNGFYYQGERPSRHPWYYAGLYYLQEPSAMSPAAWLPIKPGDRVLDLCAAPGGKSTELAAKLAGTGVLFSNDISNSRAKALLKNLEMFGAGNICVTSEAWNNQERAKVVESKEPAAVMNIEDVVPADPKQPYDVRNVIKCIVDDSDFLEVQELWAANIVIGFGRMGGETVGFVANQPMVLAGVLDCDSADKAARFIRFCDSFNIPIITLEDMPGYLPGVDQEHAGVIRHGAKVLYAYSEATVPKITVILRKAYGGGYIAMNSRHLGADFMFAWPSAEIAVMGPEGAANIIFRKEIMEAEDQNAMRQEKVKEYIEKFANPYVAASKGFIDSVIEPKETRSLLLHALKLSVLKEEYRPAKKHGLPPF